MTTPKLNIADFFIEMHRFADKVKALHQYSDLPEDEKKRIRSAIKIIKMEIEELLNSVEGTLS